MGNIIGIIAHFIAFNAGVIALVTPLRFDGISLRLHLPISSASVVLVCSLIAFLPRISRLVASLVIAGRSLVALHDASFLLGPGLFAGLGNGLLLGYLMYRSGLVPRQMAIVGLIGGTLLTFPSSVCSSMSSRQARSRRRS